MSDWSAGYVDEIEYTYGYYAELNPERMVLPFLNFGVEYPRVVNACELGFGQGISTNFHAAGGSVNWYGNDFNPAQASFAQKLASASGSGADLTDESFSDFCRRSDLPNFDYIGLHGIWSWISDENRKIIVDFIRKKLNIGGVVYISYNTLPGWAAFSPLRELMIQHASSYGVPAHGIEKRIDGAVNYCGRLFSAKSKFTEHTFGVKERFDRLKDQDRHYLAHEYFNKDWQPMYFKDMYNWMSDAKLEFVCSANYLDSIDQVNLTEEQLALLNEVADPTFKETLRDFLTNQQFRKDYWVKGKTAISKTDKLKRLKNLRVILCSNSLDAPETVTGLLGEAKLAKNVYQAILDTLADRKPRSLSDIARSVAKKNVSFEMVLQAVFILVSLGTVAKIPESEVNKKEVKRLNKKIMEISNGSTKVAYLLSPITGTGITVVRFNQLFVEAIHAGLKKPEDWANHVCVLLDSQNQKILKDGQPLATFDENFKELLIQAKEFQKTDYPVLQSLGIV